MYEAQKKYASKHPEKIRENSKKYYYRNRDQILERRKIKYRQIDADDGQTMVDNVSSSDVTC